MNYITDSSSTIGLILRCLFYTIFFINAAIIGWLIDVFIANNKTAIDANEITRIVSLTFCGLWGLMKFFPTYSQRSRLISSVFPIRFVERWMIDLAYNITTASTVGTVVAFFLIDALSKTYTHIHLSYSLMLFGNTVACVQLIKAFIETAHRNRFVLLTFWLILICTITLLVMYSLSNYILLVVSLGVCMIGNFSLLAYADWLAIERNNHSAYIDKISLFNQLSPVYFAFLKNSKSRSAFGLGLILKTGILFSMNLSFTKTVPMNEFLNMIYITPLILFTYVANNIWGHLPELWINSTLGKRSDTHRIYFQLISFPILLDLIITIAVLLYISKVDVKLLIFYILSTIVLSLNGLVFSLYKAFYVKTSFSFGQTKNNVNGWSILTAAALVSLITLDLKSIILTSLLIIGLIAGSWYLFNRVLQNSMTNKYSLYEKLFTNQD